MRGQSVVLSIEYLPRKVTGIRPMAPSKIEVHSTIYDSKILNLWTTKPCFEIIHGLLVSVFDKVSRPSSPDLQPNTRRVLCKLPSFRKAKIVQKQKKPFILFQSN